LYLPFAGVPEPAIDSPWTLAVKRKRGAVRTQRLD
jgi:hypothetical protein